MSYVCIRIHCQTDELLEKCKEEYRRYHPSEKDVAISMNTILRKLAYYYLTGNVDGKFTKDILSPDKDDRGTR